MIGDRSHDIVGASANGVASIGVLWGYGDLAELTAAGATAIAARPSELPEIVGELLLARNSLFLRAPLCPAGHLPHRWGD